MVTKLLQGGTCLQVGADGASDAGPAAVSLAGSPCGLACGAAPDMWVPLLTAAVDSRPLSSPPNPLLSPSLAVRRPLFERRRLAVHPRAIFPRWRSCRRCCRLLECAQNQGVRLGLTLVPVLRALGGLLPAAKVDVMTAGGSPASSSRRPDRCVVACVSICPCLIAFGICLEPRTLPAHMPAACRAPTQL
jgi:hypothetical protein